MSKEFKATTKEQINIEDIQRTYNSLVNNKKPAIYDIVVPYREYVNIYHNLYKQYEEIERLNKEIERQNEEIERLNKFEKWIDEQLTISQVHGNRLGVNVCNICKDKLKELKGSDK